MHTYTLQHDYLETYYCIYLGTCATLTVWISWILRRAGRVFLNDVFVGNTILVRAVARLLDIGFYLVSIGYVAVSYQTMWPINDPGTVVRIASVKIGGLLFLLGVAHFFNLLLLALFRQRRPAGAAPVIGA